MPFLKKSENSLATKNRFFFGLFIANFWVLSPPSPLLEHKVLPPLEQKSESPLLSTYFLPLSCHTPPYPSMHTPIGGRGVPGQGGGITLSPPGGKWILQAQGGKHQFLFRRGKGGGVPRKVRFFAMTSFDKSKKCARKLV